MIYFLIIGAVILVVAGIILIPLAAVVLGIIIPMDIIVQLDKLRKTMPRQEIFGLIILGLLLLFSCALCTPIM